MKEKADYYTKLIQRSLSDDLLKREYLIMPNRHKTTGHCYIAAEALYHLLGGKENLSTFTGRDSDNVTHWWLVDKKTREIYDPTAEQYYHENDTPPYDKGRACGFLTREPSKRCTILLDRVKAKIKNESSNPTKTTTTKNKKTTRPFKI